MKKEIAAAVCFFKTLLMPRSRPDPEKADLFFESLAVALMEKFRGHWFPENPSRGQAYRYASVRSHFQFKADPSTVSWCVKYWAVWNHFGFLFFFFCRCIRINEFRQQDADVLRACEESRIEIHELELPVNLTVWVDPGEVSYRLHFYSTRFSLVKE